MVQSVRRAFHILESLAAAPSGVSEVSRRTGLPKSTVARLLGTLEDVSAVERSPDRHTYRIGSSVRGLAASGTGIDHLASLAQPFLRTLATLTGESAGLAIPHGYNVHYITQVDSENPVQVRDWSGELIPMHAVPSGLAIMAHWPGERLDRYVERPLEMLTPNTVIDPEELRVRLERTHDKGHVWVYEEFVEGLNSVASSVVDGEGHVLAALHVHGPAYRFPRAGDEAEIGHHVATIASQLSARLAAGIE